jgi:hypothetical protein
MINKTQRILMRVLLGITLAGAPPLLPQAVGGGIGKALLGRALKGNAGNPAAKSAWSQIYKHDAARHAATPAKPSAAPRTVHRYTTSKQGTRETKQGLKPDTHMTPAATPGRPLTAGHAQQRYGIETKPEVRMTIELPKGFPVRHNKALAGEPGRGELTSPQALPPDAIKRVVRLPQ